MNKLMSPYYFIFLIMFMEEFTDMKKELQKEETDLLRPKRKTTPPK